MVKPVTFAVNVRYEDDKTYRAMAEQAARLKAHGRVSMNIDTLAEPTPYSLDRPSPWHQYLNYLPGLVKTVPHPDLQPHLDMDHVKRNKTLMLKQAAILKECGLEASYHAPEPAFWPESFFKQNPHMRGPRVDHPRRGTREEFAPCTDLPEVQAMFAWMIAELKRQVPGLTTFSFRANDVGSGFCWCSALYTGMHGPSHCQFLDPGVRIARFVDVLHKGAEDGGGPVRISFNGNFYNNEVYSIAPKLGENSFLQGWKDDAVNLHSIMADPIRGLLQPLDIMQAFERAQAPGIATLGLNFGPSYRRTSEAVAAAEQVIDIVENLLKNPTDGLKSRYDRLHDLCTAWAGKKKAETLFEAFTAFKEAVAFKRAAYERGAVHTLGVTNRHITRPLVIKPELLTAEEEAYFLPHIFNPRENEARMDYMDVHGGRQAINPLLRQAAAALKAASDRFAAVKDAQAADLVAGLAAGTAAWASVLRSVCNFDKAQQIRDRHKERLAGPEQVPPKESSFEGAPDYLPWNEIMRDEFDNAAELQALVKAHPGCIATAAKAAAEDMFVLGPDLAGALQQKMDIMRAHWRDVEQWIEAPHK